MRLTIGAPSTLLNGLFRGPARPGATRPARAVPARFRPACAAGKGKVVRVPYSVVYDLRGDRISALRIYFPMSLLMEQLSG